MYFEMNVYLCRCRVRIGYNWRDLWSTLIALLKFVVSNESSLSKKQDFFTICSQVIQIFNVFITYGDTFLPSAMSYDELYYELVRKGVIAIIKMTDFVLFFIGKSLYDLHYPVDVIKHSTTCIP